jgi:hypothetical protein
MQNNNRPSGKPAVIRFEDLKPCDAVRGGAQNRILFGTLADWQPKKSKKALGQPESFDMDQASYE